MKWRRRPGMKLAQMLLAHFQAYLQGAKDPDNVFKDFENHVLHVRDGYWGGATKLVAKWLDTSLKMLSEQKLERSCLCDWSVEPLFQRSIYASPYRAVGA